MQKQGFVELLSALNAEKVSLQEVVVCMMDCGGIRRVRKLGPALIDQISVPPIRLVEAPVPDFELKAVMENAIANTRFRNIARVDQNLLVYEMPQIQLQSMSQCKNLEIIHIHGLKSNHS